jgi:thiazole tautomerase (transcriptional regulator TenI)
MCGQELHVISDGKRSFVDFATIAGRIHPYVTAIHLREKAKTAEELWEGILLLLAAGVPIDKIIINDRVDVAVCSGAAGVQLANHSLSVSQVKQCFPLLRIGCSVHSLQQAKEAELQGASYVMFGHIYPSQSKLGLAPRGIEQLQEIVENVEIPVIAIGGIRPEHLTDLRRCQVAGIAVISGVLDASDPLQAVKEYSHLLKKEC